MRIVEHILLGLSLTANVFLLSYLAHMFRLFDPAPIFKDKDGKPW